MSVGTRIRTLRKKKGLTQKQLGELCGMADSAIRFYESDRGNPTHKTIERIANALGVHVFDLVGIGEDMDKLKLAKLEIVRPISGNLADLDLEKLREQILLASDVRKMYDMLQDGEKVDFWRMIAEAGPDIDNPRARINAALNRLSEEGQEKAAESIEIIVGNPKYQRKASPEDKDTTSEKKPPEGS